MHKYINLEIKLNPIKRAHSGHSVPSSVSSADILLPVAVSLKIRPNAVRPWMHLGLLSLLFLISALEQISQVHNGGIMNVSVTFNISSLRALSESTTQQLQKQTSLSAPLTALNGF